MWQNIYYIPSIDNVKIKVRIPDGKKIQNITSFLPVAFSQKEENNILEITIPRIEAYQGLVIEMQ